MPKVPERLECPKYHLSAFIESGLVSARFVMGSNSFRYASPQQQTPTSRMQVTDTPGGATEFLLLDWYQNYSGCTSLAALLRRW